MIPSLFCFHRCRVHRGRGWPVCYGDCLYNYVNIHFRRSHGLHSRELWSKWFSKPDFNCGSIDWHYTTHTYILHRFQSYIRLWFVDINKVNKLTWRAASSAPAPAMTKLNKKTRARRYVRDCWWHCSSALCLQWGSIGSKWDCDYDPFATILFNLLCY